MAAIVLSNFLRRPYWAMFICFVLVVLVFIAFNSFANTMNGENELMIREDFKDIHKVHRQGCISHDISLDNFHQVLLKWSKTRSSSCRSSYDLFSTMFYFRKSDTEVVLSQNFLKKVSTWFNGNKDLVEQTKHQYILSIMNKYTKDGTLMNPLRNKRPGFGGGDEIDKIVNTLSEESKKDCDFCYYENNTGMDSFGYLESKYSVTVANTFKIEKFHSLALWRHHNPVQFNKEQFLDIMRLIQEWFRKSREVDQSFIFPSLLWDILPKASASQIHPHIHMFLSKDHYFSGWEKIFRAAVEYKKINNRNYFTDLIKIHSFLRLNITHGSAVALVSLTPSVSNEVLIFSPKINKDLFELFYKIMKAFMVLKLYAVTAGAVFPPLDPKIRYNDMDVPCIIRIVNRGALDKARSDISSMELIGSGNINVDLWDFKKKLVDSFESI